METWISLRGLFIETQSQSIDFTWVGVYIMYTPCNHLIKEHTAFLAASFYLYTQQLVAQEVEEINAWCWQHQERLPSEPQQQNWISRINHAL